MNKTLINIFGVIVTIVLITLGILKLNDVVRPTDTDGAHDQIEVYHSQPEDTVEVVVYGSSRAYRGVNVMDMYEKYGIGAYNYAWNWQSLSTMRLFVEDSFITQTPRVALIETGNVGAVMEDTPITAEIYYTRYLYVPKARQEYLKQCFGNNIENWLSYYMPLCAFHENWSTLTEASFERSTEYLYYYGQSMGYDIWDNDTKPVMVASPESLEQKELSDTSVKTLDEIVSLCKAEGTRIVFFATPADDDYAYREAMKAYAADNDCVYLDLYELADEIGIDGSTDFQDFVHLNRSGASKVADYLGAYLKDNYELTDMREIPGNPWIK